MSFREVSVIEVREVLRLWQRGDRGERPIAALSGVDRKTVRRYIAAGISCGLVRDGDEAQLTDELIGQVVALVRPERPRGHGSAWEACDANRERIKQWLEQGLTVVKIHVLLGRRGVVVPYRTLHRFCAEELGYRRAEPTVRVADCDPGQELQVDFGKMGLRRALLDALSGDARRTPGDAAATRAAEFDASRDNARPAEAQLRWPPATDHAGLPLRDRLAGVLAHSADRAADSRPTGFAQADRGEP